MKRINWLMLLSLIFVSLSIEGNMVYASQMKIHDSQVDLSEVSYIHSESKRDIKLENAFSNVYDLKRGENNVRYYYNRVDLNNDKVPETFVYLTGPFLCGTGGCSGLIFEQVNDQYKLVSRFSLVRTPVIISDKMTNGWKNIVMYVAGGGMKGTYKELMFNGKTYPLNPSIQPDAKGKIKGLGIISDDLTKNKGITF